MSSRFVRIGDRFFNPDQIIAARFERPPAAQWACYLLCPGMPFEYLIEGEAAHALHDYLADKAEVITLPGAEDTFDPFPNPEAA